MSYRLLIRTNALLNTNCKNITTALISKGGRSMFTININLLFNFYIYIKLKAIFNVVHPQKTVIKQLKYIGFCLALLFGIAPAFAQVKQPGSLTPDLKNFDKKLTKAKMAFIYPAGFKEVKAVDTDNYNFDYGIIAPEGDCEIWFKVQSQKDSWKNYIKAKNDNLVVSPDSLYNEIGANQARAFKSDTDPLVRTIPPMLLTRYNADLGKTYLINLPDMAATKHYKYAMLVVMQKNKTGVALAVCFANELGPGFFSNLNKASSCLKFNPS